MPIAGESHVMCLWGGGHLQLSVIEHSGEAFVKIGILSAKQTVCMQAHNIGRKTATRHVSYHLSHNTSIQSSVSYLTCGATAKLLGSVRIDIYGMICGRP